MRRHQRNFWGAIFITLITACFADAQIVLPDSMTDGAGNLRGRYAGMESSASATETLSPYSYSMSPYSNYESTETVSQTPYQSSSPSYYPGTTTLYSSKEFSEKGLCTNGLVPYLPNRENNLSVSLAQQSGRNGFFQKARFNALWVPDTGTSKTLGLTNFDLGASFAMPFPKPESPLVMSPFFNAYFFRPPGKSIDLYGTGVDFRWFIPVIEKKWTLDIGAAPSYWGDFKAKTNKVLRVPAHLAAIWECNPRTKVVFGVAYLDRADSYKWLPTIGLIWTPNDDVSIELVMPRFRVAQRIRWWGSQGTQTGTATSDWLYTSLEFGGGSWYRRLNGTDSAFSNRHTSLALGYEKRCASGFTMAFELGFMFDRVVETTDVSFYPENAIFLQLRTTY